MNSGMGATTNVRPRVLLWGGLSQGRILQDMIHDLDLGSVEIIFDPTLSEAAFPTGARFLTSVTALKSQLHLVTHFAVGIGSEHGLARSKTAAALSALGLKAVSCIHPNSHIEPSVHAGPGLQMMPFALLHKFASIGSHVIVNSHAVVEHECVIGDGVHIMPAATLAGRVRVDNFASIGSNATVLPNLHIGEGAFVAAGAVVTADVAPWSLVAGNPARRVRAVKPLFLAEPVAALAGP